MLFRSMFFANILMLAICFESTVIRMSIIIFIYSFSFFIIVMKAGDVMAYPKKADVDWYIPKTKRAFAHSTQATSDLIEVLVEQYLTIIDVYNAINYDDEAKQILKYYIDKGYGNFILRDMLQSNFNGYYRKLENENIIALTPNELKQHLDFANIDNIKRTILKQLPDDYDYNY